MSEDTQNNDLEIRLAEDLCNLWEEAHGVQIGNARAEIDDDRVRVYFEGVLSQAERESLLRDEGHRLIQQYTEQLVAIIQPALHARVEAITKRRVIACQIQTYLEVDRLECQFSLV